MGICRGAWCIGASAKCVACVLCIYWARWRCRMDTKGYDWCIGGHVGRIDTALKLLFAQLKCIAWTAHTHIRIYAPIAVHTPLSYINNWLPACLKCVGKVFILFRWSHCQFYKELPVSINCSLHHTHTQTQTHVARMHFCAYIYIVYDDDHFADGPISMRRDKQELWVGCNETLIYLFEAQRRFVDNLNCSVWIIFINYEWNWME